jgi:hypothetical protein
MVTFMRFFGIALLVSLILALAPSGAAAQSHAAPSDPEANSPSGAVYELPLDRARKDAAPRRGGGGNRSNGQGSGGDPARSDTSIRSENNFGSSSQVPGVSSGEGDDDGSGAGSGSGGSNGSGGSGSGGSGSGGDGGSESDDPLAKSRAEELASRATGTPVAPGGPSNGVVIPLVAALLAVGAAIGIVAGRRARTLRRRDI